MRRAGRQAGRFQKPPPPPPPTSALSSPAGAARRRPCSASPGMDMMICCVALRARRACWQLARLPAGLVVSQPASQPAGYRPRAPPCLSDHGRGRPDGERREHTPALALSRSLPLLHSPRLKARETHSPASQPLGVPAWAVARNSEDRSQLASRKDNKHASETKRRKNLLHASSSSRAFASGPGLWPPPVAARETHCFFPSPSIVPTALQFPSRARACKHGCNASPKFPSSRSAHPASVRTIGQALAELAHWSYHTPAEHWH